MRQVAALSTPRRCGEMHGRAAKFLCGVFDYLVVAGKMFIDVPYLMGVVFAVWGLKEYRDFTVETPSDVDWFTVWSS